MAKNVAAVTLANRAAGYAGIVLVALTVLLQLFMWSISFSGSWVTIAFVLAFAYFTYRTLRAKQNLAWWEWLLFAAVAAVWVFYVFVIVAAVLILAMVL